MRHHTLTGHKCLWASGRCETAVAVPTCRWDLKAALLHLPNRRGNPVLQITINVEHKTVSCARVRSNQWRAFFFFLYEALTQASSWVSCDSNPFICCLRTKHSPNVLIYPNTPTYFTAKPDFLKAKTPGLVLYTCGIHHSHKNVTLTQRHLDTTPHTRPFIHDLWAHIQVSPNM